MAGGTVILVKAATALATDKKARKVIGWIFLAIFAPLILIIITIFAMVSGASQQVSTVIDLSFNSKLIIPESMESSVELSIIIMRECFEIIDNKETGFDKTKIKSVFFVLYFDEKETAKEETEQFTDSFIGSDMEVIYQNLEDSLQRKITDEDKNNIQTIYDYIANGVPIAVPIVGLTGFVEPVADWRSSVTSEFGGRIHPITKVWEGHGGIDIGKPYGTPIYASLSGVVVYATWDNSYGYFVKIDHGNGFETLYAHNSKNLVTAGQTVNAGEKIAEVGSTGDSTGNHLHFEVRVNGERVEPRNYLP